MLRSSIFDKKLFSKVFVFTYLIAFSLFICLLSRQNAFTSRVPYNDSSVFMTIAKGMMNGKVPYLDFFDHKGPFLYFLNYCGYSMGGIHGVWIIELIALTIAVFFTYLSVKNLFGRIVALLSTTVGCLLLRLCFEGGNLTEEYVLPLICIALYIFISIIQSENSSAWQAIILGFTFGLSLMLRPNMFSVWFIFSAYWVLNCLYRKKYSAAFRYVLFFGIGVLIGVLPFIIYLLRNHAFRDYIYQNFTFNSQYATHNGLKSILVNAFDVTYSLSYTIVLSLVSCVVGFFTQKKNKQTVFILLFLSTVLSVLFVSVSQYIFGHYYIVFIPLIAVSLSVLISLFRSIVIKYGLCDLYSDILIVVIVFGVTLNSFYNIRCDIINSFATKQPNDEVITVIEKLDVFADKNDSIQVLENNCWFYLYSDLKPANKFIYDLPIADISTDVHKQFVEAWMENSPTYVIAPQHYMESISEHNKWVIEQLKNQYMEIYKTENYILYGAIKHE